MTLVIPFAPNTFIFKGKQINKLMNCYIPKLPVVDSIPILKNNIVFSAVFSDECLELVVWFKSEILSYAP